MSKELSEMSLDELKSQEKGQTIILSIFIGLVVIMAVAGGKGSTHLLYYPWLFFL